LPNSRKKIRKKKLFPKEMILKKVKDLGWVKNTKSSDTSIENASSNQSLENLTKAFGEISINSYSEFIIKMYGITS